jgi:hypothetical protein
MEYKGFTVSVTVSSKGSSTVRRLSSRFAAMAPFLHEDAVHEQFANEIAAEDEAYRAIGIDRSKVPSQLARAFPRILKPKFIRSTVSGNECSSA